MSDQILPRPQLGSVASVEVRTDVEGALLGWLPLPTACWPPRPGTLARFVVFDEHEKQLRLNVALSGRGWPAAVRARELTLPLVEFASPYGIYLVFSLSLSCYAALLDVPAFEPVQA